VQSKGKSMGDIKELLRSSEIFEDLTEAELDRIAKQCREEVYEAGTTIFKEGDEARELYIVEEGRVALEVTLHIGSGVGRQGIIDVITKGGIFGSSAFCEINVYTNSARCVEKTRVLVMTGGELCSLFEDDIRAGYKVMQKLVNIVRSRFEHIADTLAHVLSITSHDLKAPLAAVESYHKVMLDGYAGEITEKQKTMLLRSSERMKGLLNLIDNILDVSRIDAREIKMGAVSLFEVVESTRGVIQPLAEAKGVKLEVEMPKELPLITGAPDRLQQVFTNLLGNAVKFTAEGGIVTLKVKADEANGYILVEVMDTGIGISPEELPKIFTDFYRGVRVDSAGAGLGLSISKKIIEAHGGKIWVESPCPESGTGSKFTFTLPKNSAPNRG